MAVLLSVAKDAIGRSRTGRGAGVKSFPAPRTTTSKHAREPDASDAGGAEAAWAALHLACQQREFSLGAPRH